MRDKLNGATLPSIESHQMDLVGNSSETIALHDDMHWFGSLVSRIPRGTNILMGGDPGVGKSTLAQQLALSATLAGERVLLIATEQTRGAIVARMTALSAVLCEDNESLVAKIQVVDDLGDLAMLPQFLARHIFGRAGRYQGATIVIIDSLHGHGNGATDQRFYGAIYEYFRSAAAAGITSVALAHMNKSHQVSGPRALEHMIDAAIVMRHGVNCRAMYIPKNRNGASRTEPFAVIIDEATTRLIPSPLSASSSARVRTISSDGPIVVEVALTLPRGERGFVKAPGLSIKEIETIVDLMSRLYAPAKAIGSLGITVRAPGGVRFRREHCLAVAVGLAAALNRVEIDAHLLLLGDIDLRGNVSPLAMPALRLIEDAYTAGIMSRADRLVAAPIEECGGIETGDWRLDPVATIAEAITKCLAQEKTCGGTEKEL